MASKIFTRGELRFLEERMSGVHLPDDTGIFSSRIKPKIIEMLEYWFHKKALLKKVLEPQKRKKRR